MPFILPGTRKYHRIKISLVPKSVGWEKYQMIFHSQCTLFAVRWEPFRWWWLVRRKLFLKAVPWLHPFLHLHRSTECCTHREVRKTNFSQQLVGRHHKEKHQKRSPAPTWWLCGTSRGSASAGVLVSVWGPGLSSLSWCCSCFLPNSHFCQCLDMVRVWWVRR